MNPERRQRIEELFRTVVDRPAAVRDTGLKAALGDRHAQTQ